MYHLKPPIRIKPTEQYEIRKSKFYKWLEIETGKSGSKQR